MRRLVLALTLTVLAAGSGLLARTVTVGVFDGAAPLVFVDPEGEAAGFYPEILRRMLHDLGHTPEFVTGLTFEDAFDRVARGQIDLLPGVTRTSSREQILRFTETPLLIAWSVVYVRPGAEVDTVFDLRDKRVGVQTGGQNGANFVSLMESFGIPFERVEYPDFESLTEAVLDRSIDAGVYFSFYHMGDQRLSPTSIVFSPADASVATARNGAVDIIGELNTRLVELKDDPDSYYFELLDEWLLQSTHYATPMWVFRVAIGLLVVALIAAAFAIVLRRQEVRIRDTLRRTELRAQALFEAQRDIVVVYRAGPGEPGTIVEANAEACSRLGYRREELVGLEARSLVREDQAVKLQEVLTAILETGKAQTTVCLVCRDGRCVETEIMASRYTTDDGIYAVTVARDISARLAVERELREAVGQKELLIKTIQHRVKNNIQTMAALVNTQLLLSDETAAAELRKTASRIHTLGLLHRLLYQSGDATVVPLGEYIKALASYISETAARPDHRIEFSVRVPSIEIDMDLALPIGLFLNEALSNAVSHAYPGDRTGTVTVSVAEHDGTVASLEVTDDGVGISELSVTDPGGLGFRMIRMLAQQLRGELTINGEKGVRLLLTMHIGPKEAGV